MSCIFALHLTKNAVFFACKNSIANSQLFVVNLPSKKNESMKNLPRVICLWRFAAVFALWLVVSVAFTKDVVGIDVSHHQGKVGVELDKDLEDAPPDCILCVSDSCK